MSMWQTLNRGIAKAFGMNVATETATLNDESFLEWVGIKRDSESKKPTSDVTYFTCLKMMSETVAKMPWKLYQRTGNGISEPIDNDIAKLMKQRPNPFMTPTTFWNAVEMNRNHYGNAYVYVRRKFRRKKYGGEYKALDMWIMPSDRVQIIVDDKGIFAGKGKIWYLYSDEYSGEQYVFRTEDVLHFKTSHCLNGIVGLPVQYILKQTVEGVIESQRFLNNLYKNGLTAKAVLEYTGELDDEAETKLRETFERFGAGSQNTGKILPVPLGMKLTPLDIKLTDSQFIELKKYSALQIAAAFGIKPNQINDYEKSSYNSSEMQQLSFYVDTMLFVLKQYEEEVNYKLLTDDEIEEGLYFKMNEKVLLRTDSKTQMEILKEGINNGIETVNEARRKLDLMDKDGGDVLIVNGTYVPLTKVGVAYDKAEDQETEEKDGEEQETEEKGDPDSPIKEPDTEGEENTDQEGQGKETAETNEPDAGQEGGEEDGEEDELLAKKSDKKND